MDFISTIEKYKIPEHAPYGLVFLLLFLIGIMGGKVIGNNKLFQFNQNKDIAVNSEAMFVGTQQNYLVIVVDRINNLNPSLESIWLFNSQPGQSTLTLIPVYPTLEGGIALADSTMAQLFSMSAGGTPGKNFFDHLSKQLEWDYFFLLDTEGYAAFLEFLNNEELDFEEASILDSLPQVWLDPAGALQGQAQLLKTACIQASNLPGLNNTIEFIQNIQPHIHTDLHLDEVIQQWSSEQIDSFQINCEFPTLVLEIQ